uniref:Uncharacterized protein n=1 Tax=Anguilla anguilla TaxID=7936 RepID=A0A0E9QU23_ANGAN
MPTAATTSQPLVSERSKNISLSESS